MNKKSIIFLFFLTTFSFGFLSGIFFYQHKQNYYELTQSVMLVGFDDQLKVNIPSGTPIMGEEPLDINGEFGWWGYIPVYMGTSSEAAEFLKSTDKSAANFYKISAYKKLK